MNIHQDNLHGLATQVFKAKLNISLEILKLLYFSVRNYYVRGQSTLNVYKQILCTLATKASRHWHGKYGD